MALIKQSKASLVGLIFLPLCGYLRVVVNHLPVCVCVCEEGVGEGERERERGGGREATNFSLQHA